MKHQICKQCIHMDDTHCICGGEWISNMCVRDTSLEDACTTSQEYLNIWKKKAGKDWGYCHREIVGSREWWEFFKEKKNTYFSSLSPQWQDHLMSNSQELQKQIIEVPLVSDSGIEVFFFLEKDDQSLLKKLRKIAERIANE